jgi:hypothetical protein
MRSCGPAFFALSVSAPLLGGCPAAHLTFAPPPDAAAPVEARTHFYETHKPMPAAREDLEVRTRLFGDRPSVTRRAASLAGGARVHHVEDLRPLVKEGSATAIAIDDTVTYDDRARLLLGGGIGVGAAGIVGALALIAVDLGVTPSTSERPTLELSPFFFGAVASFLVGTAGGGALATWGVSVRDDADIARTKAFSSYDADLKTALGLAASE